MTKDTRRDIKFYVSLFLGFSLLVLGCLLPPPGEVSSGILIGSGMLLTITAGLIGVDLSKVIKEFRFLKEAVSLSEEEKEDIKREYMEELRNEN